MIVQEAAEIVKVEKSTYSLLLKHYGGWKMLLIVNLAMTCFMFSAIYSNKVLL